MGDAVRIRIGAMLRALREKRGLTLSQVQDLTRQIDWPVSRSRLSLLERGEVEIHLSDLYPLSRTYGFAIGPLISEAIVAHSRKKFAKGLDSTALFEQAKEFFRVGKPLEAAWAFDEAGRRTDDSAPDFKHLCMISAGHCYERVGALELALSRIETTVDDTRASKSIQLRAIAKAAVLRAKAGSPGRAKIYLQSLESFDLSKLKPELRAFLLSTQADALNQLGQVEDAIKHVRRASHIFKRLGDSDRIAKTLAILAKYLLRLGQSRLTQAVSVAREARSYLQPESQIEIRIFVLTSAGEALLRRGNWTQSRELLLQANHLAASHGFEKEESVTASLLRELATREGNRAEEEVWRQRLRKIGRTFRALDDGLASYPLRGDGP